MTRYRYEVKPVYYEGRIRWEWAIFFWSDWSDDPEDHEWREGYKGDEKYHGWQWRRGPAHREAKRRIKTLNKLEKYLEEED